MVKHMQTFYKDPNTTTEEITGQLMPQLVRKCPRFLTLDDSDRKYFM